MSDPRFVELLDAYWTAAYAQGKEGRNHDDRKGSAQIAESNLCHYVESLRSALSTARAEGKREGMEEAAKVADLIGYEDQTGCNPQLVPPRVAAAIRAKIEEVNS